MGLFSYNKQMPFKSIEKRREKNRLWRSKNPNYSRDWFKKHPGYFDRYKSINRPRHRSGLQGRDIVREKVRVRDNWTCQSCLKKWEPGTRRFDVHHLNGLCGKKSKLYDRKEDMGTLITLCHRCHFNHPEHSRNQG